MLKESILDEYLMSVCFSFFSLTSRYDSTGIELRIPTFSSGEDFFDCFSDAFSDYSRYSSIQPAYSLFSSSSLVLYWVQSIHHGKK